jgi:hypothetical protein
MMLLYPRRGIISFSAGFAARCILGALLRALIRVQRSPGGFVCFFALILVPGGQAVFAQNYIDIDLRTKEIKVVDFYLGNVPVSGNFSFSTAREGDSLSAVFDGRDVSVGEKKFSWVKAKVVKKNEFVFLRHLQSPEFLMQGIVDFNKEEVSLDLSMNTLERTPLVEGLIKAKVHMWGKMYNVSASGYMTIENGVCQGTPIERAYFNFVGSPPLLNLTDSELVLKDGSIYKLQGMVDLRNSDSILSNARFTSRKVALNGWELLSESHAQGTSKAAGVKKELENFDVLFNTYEKKDDEYAYNTTTEKDPANTGAEVRYKLTDDQFLKLRMQEDSTIVGFEHRKEF